jgi:hypothetical protein
MKLLDPANLRAAELFFHVLSHVGGTRRLPASVYSAEYIAWARGRLGSAEERTLGEDAQLLAGAFPTHGALAELQVLARLFGSLQRLRSVRSRALAELRPGDVDDPAMLARLCALGAPGELAFCALTLELGCFEQLPSPPPAPLELLHALRELVPLAPGLAEARVGCVRSLHLRGRVWGSEIWVGHPAAEVAPTIEHAAWQAAHEATVVAVAAREKTLHEREVEEVAVSELTRTALAAGKGREHARWLEVASSLV